MAGDERGGPGPLDCEACQHGARLLSSYQPPRSDQDRREMHCGWIPESEWVQPGSVPRRIGATLQLPGAEWGGDVCPGWAIRQPLIQEIAQAYAAYDKGCLETVFPYPANALIEGVLEAQSSFNCYEREMIAARAEESKSG